MSGCCTRAYGKVFGERAARRAADRYRKKGLDKDARWVVDVLRERGLEDARVLELGGGVGALHLELVRQGAASAVNIELSPEWEDEAGGLLREHGLETRVQRRVGDAVQEAQALEPADVVVMHRVVCCYPDADRLMDVAAARAGRFLAVSFPRDRLVARLVVAAENLFMRVRRIAFRSYIHPEPTIEAAAIRNGLRPLLDRTGTIWRVAVFEGGSAEPGAPSGAQERARRVEAGVHRAFDHVPLGLETLAAARRPVGSHLTPAASARTRTLRWRRRRWNRSRINSTPSSRPVFRASPR